MANDPQVAVRFAVKDAEVVRQALQNLGKDGEAALKRFDAAAKPIPKGLTAVSDTVAELKSRAAQLAGSTGIAGTALLGLGGVGLAAAASLGAVYLAFTRISDGAKAAGQYARDVRDFANATGFTATQVQALSDVFLQNGIAQDKARSGLEKFQVAREQARQGDGELYQTLRRTNAALAEQFAAAQSAPEALGLFTKALQQADETTRAFLARAAFGRGGVAFAQALLDMAGRGGLGAIEAAAIKTGAAFEENVIQKQAAAAIEAERKAQIVERNWNAAYAAIYARWKEFKKLIGIGDNNEITIAVNFRMAMQGQLALGDRPEDVIKKQLDDVRRRLEEKSPVLGDDDPNKPAFGIRPYRRGRMPMAMRQQLEAERAELEAELQRRFEAGFDPDMARARTAERSVAMPKERSKEDQRAELERTNKLERERLGVLGDTATAQELMRAKENELTLARMNGAKVTDAELVRIKEGYAIQLAARDVALHAQLGVTTATELYAQKLRELNQQRALGKLSEEQYADALKLSRKEIEDQIKAQEVRKSDFPQLTKLGQDAGNFKLQLDTELSGALRGVTSDLLAMTKGTETAAQGFTNMATKMVDAIAQAVLMKTVVGPLAGALSSGLGGLFGGPGGAGATGGANAIGAGVVASALGNVFPGGLGLSNSIVDRPTLIPMARGGALIGEAGPEGVIPLRRVNGRLGVDATGIGGGINVTHTVNNYAGVEVTNTSQRRGMDVDIMTVVRPLAAAMADQAARGHGPMAPYLPRPPLRG